MLIEPKPVCDPRHVYPRPPFTDQVGIDMPGYTGEMTPAPDHGESSYVGHGRLRDRTVLITGGDSGIGRAVTIACAREGAAVVLNYLEETEDAEDTRSIAEAAGTQVVAVRGDLREERFCSDLIERAVAETGQLDVLINNAAYQETHEDLEEVSTELFDRIMKTNVYAPFWLTRAALPHIPLGGSVINTASIQAYDPSPALLPYATTKSALVGMTKALAKLCMDRGVRVNAVAPGPVWTPLIPGSMPPDKIASFGADTVFGRPAQPVELAPLYIWLASREASYVTGEVYGATGGQSPF